jgi:DNA-binding response OmpR family regulator
MQHGKHVILVIDDDPDVREVLKTVLESNGYLFAEAASAEDGLKVFKSARPDVVIVDLMMEEVDAGTSFVKELRVLGSKAPIYMLSSVGDNLSLATDTSTLGLAGVFQKPVDFDNLLGVLKAKLAG